MWAGQDSKGYRASPQVGLDYFYQAKPDHNNKSGAYVTDGSRFESITQHNKSKTAPFGTALLLWAGLDLVACPVLKELLFKLLIS